jgi:hypothetical protein
MYCYDKKCYRCTAIYQYTLKIPGKINIYVVRIRSDFKSVTERPRNRAASTPSRWVTARPDTERPRNRATTTPPVPTPSALETEPPTTPPALTSKRNLRYTPFSSRQINSFATARIGSYVEAFAAEERPVVASIGTDVHPAGPAAKPGAPP